MGKTYHVQPFFVGPMYAARTAVDQERADIDLSIGGSKNQWSVPICITGNFLSIVSCIKQYLLLIHQYMLNWRLLGDDRTAISTRPSFAAVCRLVLLLSSKSGFSNRPECVFSIRRNNAASLR